MILNKMCLIYPLLQNHNYFSSALYMCV